MPFEIASVQDERLFHTLQEKLKQRFGKEVLSSPLGKIALQIGLIYRSGNPILKKPSLLIFAGDHGITRDFKGRISQENTSDMVLHFLEDARPLNRLCREQKITLRVVDLGVDHHFENLLSYWLHHGSEHINRKVDLGTQNFTHSPAMTTAQCTEAFETGADLVRQERNNGCNILAIGAIGAGNRISAIALMVSLLDIRQSEIELSAEEDDIVFRALRKHPKTHDAFTLLTLYGGYEIAAMTGAFLQAAENKMVLLVDGFVAAAALLVASNINAVVMEYVIFCDEYAEPHYRQILDHFKLEALLHTGMSSGDGTGAVLAYPLIKSAVSFLREQKL
ncbi:MAG: nicotinate-nucleotide--dimethylbenzimidazole phosphoribosyltransferase [Owenweeksia sp.]